MKKLYLIDGMSLVFRAYHAMSKSGLRSPSGETTSAVFAFANIITSLLEKENPEHIAVVFDTAAPTFRHDMYSLYKANRDAFPEDLVPQLARIKELLDYLSLPRVELPGWEADDVIGTLAKKAAQNGSQAICITSDKDYCQLVDDNIKLYKPGKVGEDFDVVDTAAVRSRYGVEPSQIIDLFAIIGDSVDNVPGVKGVGDKTATPLIQKYGTLENIYDHLNEIEKEPLRKKFEENKEMAILSKKLVTIDVDSPVESDIDNFHWKEPKFRELDEFFKLMGFNTLRNKWKAKIKEGQEFEDEFQSLAESEALPIQAMPQTQQLTDIKHDYILVNTIPLLDDMLRDISTAKLLSVDLETDSLDRQSCNIVGIAICAVEDKSYYVAVDDLEEKAQPDYIEFQNSMFESHDKAINEQKDETAKKEHTPILPVRPVIEKLKEIFESPEVGKCGQNIKFDAFILKRYGIELSPIVFDTMLASYLLNSDDQHNLDALSKKWLNYTPIPISSLIGEKKSKQISMREVDPAIIAEYAGEDADLALKLTNILKPQLIKEDMLKLAEEIEFPMIEVLIHVESNGVAIDTKSLGEISEMIVRESANLTKKIYAEAGQEFNIDSPKQLAGILFEKLMIPPISKTKTGYSTDVGVLSQLAPIYPIAEYVLEYRQLMKLQSTYVESLPKLINPRTGRIHTTFNQTVASTGRLSSTDPNLQNIPIRTDLGKEIRKAFVPQYPDRVILSADYSQIELRIMAYICQDKQLIEAFKNGLDIHAATAAILFDVELDQVNSDMRRVAKTVNFGIMYGLGSFGLSQRLNLGRNQSKEIIDNYFRKYPGIKKYIDLTIADTQKKGYASTICGRRRYFENINAKNRMLKTAAERAAINMPIQGTASDMMKLAMINIDREMRRRQLKSMMTIQVHDELVFEVFPEELEELTVLVKDLMEKALPLGEVPVIAETGTGKSWFEAH